MHFVLIAHAILSTVAQIETPLTYTESQREVSVIHL